MVDDSHMRCSASRRARGHACLGHARLGHPRVLRRSLLADSGVKPPRDDLPPVFRRRPRRYEGRVPRGTGARVDDPAGAPGHRGTAPRRQPPPAQPRWPSVSPSPRPVWSAALPRRTRQPRSARVTALPAPWSHVSQICGQSPDGLQRPAKCSSLRSERDAASIAAPRHADSGCADAGQEQFERPRCDPEALRPRHRARS